jgi:hypothetical protein
MAHRHFFRNILYSVSQHAMADAALILPISRRAFLFAAPSQIPPTPLHLARS